MKKLNSLENIFSLEGKNVIVTGGLGFLASYFIPQLIYAGARVIIFDLFSHEDAVKKLENYSKDIKEKIDYYECDVTDSKKLNKISKILKGKYKIIHAIINNAALNPKVETGTLSKSAFDKVPLEEWSRTLEVNLTGPMLCCQIFRPLFKSGASIVNIASMYGIVAPDQRAYGNGVEKPASYGVAKAGLINLTKYLSSYWGRDNIRVNAVAFGGIYNNQNKHFVKEYSMRSQLGRMGRPEETAGIIIFLISDASSYATGGIFVVDGGWTAW